MPRERRNRPVGITWVASRGTFVLRRPGHAQCALNTDDDTEAMLRALEIVAETTAAPPPAVTVREVAAAYEWHVKVYYQKGGKPTKEVAEYLLVLDLLCDEFGDLSALEFGPRRLKALRDTMLRQTRRGESWSRGVVNQRIGRVVRCFRWAVGDELVPPDVHSRLAAVPGLKKGRTTARESRPILPVGDDMVQATLEHLPALVADMVRFQRLTGCRPAEVCLVRPVDVDATVDVWAYRPESHKAEHHGRDRVIYIGPRAQAVLEPYLVRHKESYCFTPAESEAQRRGKPGRKLKPDGQYTPDSYRRAIHRACARAEVPPWSPNRLRHSAGTEIRREFGLEAAQVVLGHARADVTETYAERDRQRAIDVARKIG